MNMIPPARTCALAIALLGLAACGKPDPDSSTSSAKAARETQDFVQIEADTTPEERRYLEVGRGVVTALAARDYAAFHGQLSSHARAQMSLNQFAPAEDDAVFEQNEKRPRLNPALSEFLDLMGAMEKQFGQPKRPLDLHVHSTEPDTLAGKKKEPMDALDILFAIGNMPALASADIRRASLRAQLQVDLSEAQLSEVAKARQTTIAELSGDPDFKPYLNVKLVLVEEAGELRVGYFEFLPPSMLD